MEGYLHPALRMDMQTAIERVNASLGIGSETEPAPEAIDNDAGIAQLNAMLGGIQR